MPLHPQVQVFLDQMAALQFPGISAFDVEQARAMGEGIEQAPGEPVAGIRDLSIPGPGGDIPIRLYLPAGDGPPPVVVLFHGGGWTIGSIDGHDNVSRALANRSGCAVASVEYRLAPEHPFPAGVEDAIAATRWTAEHAGELGVDGSRLVVAGDSAGGNLAAVVALHARDAGGPAIAHQVLVYPATDLRSDWPSYHENGEGYFLTVKDMQWFEGHYLPSIALRQDWRVSPAAAADHRGLPPALIITAEYDPLRDQGEAYGEILRVAGVPVRVVRYPGMIHAFWSLDVLDASRTAMDEIAAEVRSALGMGEPAPLA
jgi:acetyl esterase